MRGDRTKPNAPNSLARPALVGATPSLGLPKFKADAPHADFICGQDVCAHGEPADPRTLTWTETANFSSTPSSNGCTDSPATSSSIPLQPRLRPRSTSLA